MFRFHRNQGALLFNPYLPSGLSHPYQMDESISRFRGVPVYLSFLLKFLYANSADPDQTPHYGLHCSPRSPSGALG